MKTRLERFINMDALSFVAPPPRLVYGLLEIFYINGGEAITQQRSAWTADRLHGVLILLAYFAPQARVELSELLVLDREAEADQFLLCHKGQLNRFGCPDCVRVLLQMLCQKVKDFHTEDGAKHLKVAFDSLQVAC